MDQLPLAPLVGPGTLAHRAWGPFLPVQDCGPTSAGEPRVEIFGTEFVEQVKAMGIKQVLPGPQSPWQRAYVERLIGSIRRERLDHGIAFGERSLRRTLGLFWDKRRPHPRATGVRPGAQHPALGERAMVHKKCETALAAYCAHYHNLENSSVPWQGHPGNTKDAAAGRGSGDRDSGGGQTAP